MEDTLEVSQSYQRKRPVHVLILVLVEDTLEVLAGRFNEEKYRGLNPCSSGRYS